MSKLYPIGIQNFESLRKDGYLYVDKTEFIYKLSQTGRYYFLSRPRRFGKSLLISAIEAYFSGRRDLFEGLAIEKLEKEWNIHPVLHLDLNADKYKSPDSVDVMLDMALTQWEAVYGKGENEQTLSARFQGVIRRAYEQTGQRVVVLIDEYDKPLLLSMNDSDLQDKFRSTLKAFYGSMKSMDGYIKFAMLTGVTKFGRVSVFSDLNNIEDVSMWSEVADICGITDEELHKYFDDDIHSLARANGLSYEEACEKLKYMYDGYHFSKNSVGVYNPFSLLNAFKKLEYGSYWFSTGTPTYLAELLKARDYDLQNLTHVEGDELSLNSVDISSRNPIPVIYQSGYLTIKGYDSEFGLYRLGFPNREVQEGFMNFLLPFYTPVVEGDSAFEISKFVREIKSGDIDAFFTRLKSFFADTPYELVGCRERHYQNVLFIVFKLMGFYVNAEYHTSQGRIDLVLQTPDYIYIMEFKLSGTAEEALQQINELQYAAPFAADSRKIVKIGVNFSPETRNIDRWIVE